VVGGYLGGKTVSELDQKEWDLMMNMNLKSAFLISNHVIPQMASSKYGKIIHVSSRTGLKSDGYDSAYAASKSGLIRLVESMSEELKKSNINVNCIMPSVIDTEANSSVATGRGLGNLTNSGLIRWHGTIFFLTNSNDRLAFLDHLIGVNEDEVDTSGSYIHKSWEWK
jgi:NAD(P)-dependent dehydrogenase (short-subunit alcohol dehydrogenase family)